MDLMSVAYVELSIRASFGQLTTGKMRRKELIPGYSLLFG
jgi:hypothetical protein